MKANRLIKSAVAPLATVCLLLAGAACGRHAEHPGVATSKAEEYLAKGQELLAEGKTDSARALYMKALADEAALPDTTRGYAYAELLAVAQAEGDMRSAIDFGRKAFEVSGDAFAPEDYGILAGNIGISYRRSGDNDSALYFYEQGLERMKSAKGNEDVSAFLCNNMSVLYTEMGRFDEGIDFARRGAELARKGGDDTEYYSALANEGVALVKKGDNASGLEKLKEVMANAEQTGSRNLVLKIANYMSFAARAVGDETGRLSYIEAGERACEGYPADNVGVQGIREARMNYECDHGNYAGAYAAAVQLDSLRDKLQVVPIYKIKAMESRCLEGLGHYQEALAKEREASALRDSLASTDINRQLSEYSVKFKTQETQIALLKAEAEARERTATMWIFIAAFILVLAALLSFVVWSRARRRRLEQRHEMERTGRYLEGLEEERTRLARELHDGACNDLFGIALSLQAPDFDRKDVGARIARLRDSLRRMSHEQMPPEFRYADIDEILRDYVAHLPLPSSLTITYSSEGSDWQSVPHAVAYQFYRIVQEAIGNIIRHSGATQGNVSLMHDAGGLRLRVSDNGRGLGPDAAEGALKSIRERAAGIGASMTKTDSDKGFGIEISYGKP